MLQIRSLSVDYGGLHALSRVSLDIEAGQFVALVGPNGAGKSTLFKAISGTVRPREGEIRFGGEDLLRHAPHARPHLGIAHVPEGRKVFASLTVMENLQLGAYTDAGRREWNANGDFIFDLFPILAERRAQLAGTLSGGQQQMLAIARGLAASPRLLMLDEPSMGLAPAVADEIFERVSRIHRERGLTILLVEQRVAEALDVCDRGFVLESGRLTASGDAAALTKDDTLRAAYLGA